MWQRVAMLLAPGISGLFYQGVSKKKPKEMCGSMKKSGDF
jgi:hypothetical protein